MGKKQMAKAIENIISQFNECLGLDKKELKNIYDDYPQRYIDQNALKAIKTEKQKELERLERDDISAITSPSTLTETTTSEWEADSACSAYITDWSSGGTLDCFDRLDLDELIITDSEDDDDTGGWTDESSLTLSTRVSEKLESSIRKHKENKQRSTKQQQKMKNIKKSRNEKKRTKKTKGFTDPETKKVNLPPEKNPENEIFHFISSTVLNLTSKILSSGGNEAHARIAVSAILSTRLDDVYEAYNNMAVASTATDTKGPLSCLELSSSLSLSDKQKFPLWKSSKDDIIDEIFRFSVALSGSEVPEESARNVIVAILVMWDKLIRHNAAAVATATITTTPATKNGDEASTTTGGDEDEEDEQEMLRQCLALSLSEPEESSNTDAEMASSSVMGIKKVVTETVDDVVDGYFTRTQKYDEQEEGEES